MIAIEWISRPRRLSRWDALAATGLCAWVVAWLFPLLPQLQRLWPSCHFRQFTGWPCGTCGFTRAFTSAARLDLAGAFTFSPLAALIFYGWMIFSLAWAATWIAAGLRLPLPRLHPHAARWAPLVLFVANWGWLLWRAHLDGGMPA